MNNLSLRASENEEQDQEVKQGPGRPKKTQSPLPPPLVIPDVDSRSPFKEVAPPKIKPIPPIPST